MIVQVDHAVLLSINRQRVVNVGHLPPPGHLSPGNLHRVGLHLHPYLTQTLT